MPPALAIAIAGLAASVGGEVYQGIQSSDASSNASSNAQAQNQSALSAQQLQAAQAGAQKQQAINAQVANADEQTGGSLNAGGLANLSSLLAGYGGQAGGGTTPTPLSSTSTSTPGLQDALSQLTSGATTQPTQLSSAFSGGS